jgi:uncharacterized phage protein (TIGR01671 family)
MREIKFRGKAKMSIEELDDLYLEHENGWVYGHLVMYGKTPYIVGDFIEVDSEYTVNEFWVPVYPESVGQFTGLPDKNGKEIYEGDIIHSLSPFFTGEGTIHDYDDDYYEVVWMEEEARFCLKKKNGLYAYVDELIEPTVKGNIFENPKILEEQHG